HLPGRPRDGRDGHRRARDRGGPARVAADPAGRGGGRRHARDQDRARPARDPQPRPGPLGRLPGMAAPRLELSRGQVVAHRRRVGLLDARVPLDAEGLREAAWAGFTDSVPRAAVLSIHARVAGTPTDVLDHPALSQVWGPRFSAYVVAEVDAPVFTL